MHEVKLTNVSLFFLLKLAELRAREFESNTEGQVWGRKSDHNECEHGEIEKQGDRNG